MYLWCFWWWDDGNTSVAVALGDFGGPVTTKRDAVVLAEVVLDNECMDGVESIIRVPDLRHGHAIVTRYPSAVPFAVKDIAKKEWIVARIMRSFCCLFEA